MSGWNGTKLCGRRKRTKQTEEMDERQKKYKTDRIFAMAAAGISGMALFVCGCDYCLLGATGMGYRENFPWLCSFGVNFWDISDSSLLVAQSKKMACYAAAVLVISWDACDLFALLYRAFVLVGDTVLAAVFCVEHGISVAGRGKTALERASQTILRGNGIRNRRNQTAVAE